MTVVDELVIKIDSDIKGALAGIKSVDTAMNKMDGTIGKSAASIRKATGTMVKALTTLGVAAAALAVASGAAFTKQSADMESYMTTLKQLEGSQQAAADKMVWLLEFARKTPFELPSLIEATIKLGAYGIEAENVLQSLGDTASAMGKPINMAVEALADAQTGEFERMKEFGIKAVVITKANAAELGATAEEVGKTALTHVDKYGKQQAAIIDRNNREQVTSTIQAIWNNKYAGGMEMQASTMRGMMSNIKDSLYQGTLAVMGFNRASGEFDAGSLFDQIKTSIDGLLVSINQIDFETVRSQVESVVDSLKPVLENLISLFNSIVGIVGDVVGAFSDAESNAATFTDVLTTLTGALASVFKWIDEHPSVTKLVVAIGTAVVVFSHVLPIISAVAGAISFLATAFGTGGLAGVMTAVAGPAIAAVVAAISAIGAPVLIVAGVIALLAAAWATNMFGIRDVTKDVFSWLKDAFMGVVNWLMGRAEDYINVYIKIYDALVPILNKAGMNLVAIGELHFKRLSKTVEDVSNDVINSTEMMSDAIDAESNAAKERINSVAAAYNGVGATTGKTAGAMGVGEGIPGWAGKSEYIQERLATTGAKNISGLMGIGGVGGGTAGIVGEVSKIITAQATQSNQLNITSILSQSLATQRSSDSKLSTLAEISAKLDTLKIEVNNYVTKTIEPKDGFDLKRNLSATQSGV